MIIQFTVFNDPSMLGKAPKRRGIKKNYAFMVHGGVPSHTKVFFTSWAKDTKGERKAYKNPIDVEERKAIEYFTRAIEKYSDEIVSVLKKYIDLGFDGKNFIIDQRGLIREYTNIANLIKNEAEEIIRAEAFDTGDLMSSVSITSVEITESNIDVKVIGG